MYEGALSFVQACTNWCTAGGGIESALNILCSEKKLPRHNYVLGLLYKVAVVWRREHVLCFSHFQLRAASCKAHHLSTHCTSVVLRVV